MATNHGSLIPKAWLNIVANAIHIFSLNDGHHPDFENKHAYHAIDQVTKQPIYHAEYFARIENGCHTVFVKNNAMFWWFWTMILLDLLVFT